MSTKNDPQVLIEDLWSDLRSRLCNPVIFEEIDEVVRLIPQERIQQRTVEQIVVVSRISSRERNGGSGPDHSPERIIRDRIVDVPVAIQRQIPTIQTIQKQWRVLQIQFIDRVVDRWRPQLRPARKVCR